MFVCVGEGEGGVGAGLVRVLVMFARQAAATSSGDARLNACASAQDQDSPSSDSPSMQVIWSCNLSWTCHLRDSSFWGAAKNTSWWAPPKTRDEFDPRLITKYIPGQVPNIAPAYYWHASQPVAFVRLAEERQQVENRLENCHSEKNHKCVHRNDTISRSLKP